MEALNKRKGIIKGQFTKFTNFIIAKGKDALIEELEVRLSKTHELYKQFIEVEDGIFKIDEKVVSEMDTLDDMYFPLVAKIQKLIREKSLNPVTHLDQDESVNTSANISFRSDFKLPRLNLPIFDGNVKHWQSFYDIFISTVHENTSLSPAQKFKYLLGQLRGAAHLSICHFRVDDANYLEAIKRLTKKYDKKKPIIETYIRDFFAMPKFNKASSNSIMKLHDVVDETVRGLKSLGPKATERDPWIILLASDKLDEESRRMWKYETAEDDYPTTQQFLDFLSKRMDALIETVPDHVNPRGYSHTRQATAKMFHSSVELPSCPICHINHRLFDCPKFRQMSVEERREFITSSKRCFNCLSNEHLITSCKSRKHCWKCSKRHNTLLHFVPDRAIPVAKQISSLPTEVNTNEADVRFAVSLHQSNLPRDTSVIPVPSSIPPRIPILPTAFIEVQDKYGNWISCRALLDSGSTHSFISEDFVNRLKVSSIQTDTKINTINSSVAGYSRGRSSLKIRSRVDHNYTVQLDALIIPTISSNLPPVHTTNLQLHVFDKYKPLADPSFNIPLKVDILLGCEPFFQSLQQMKFVQGNRNSPIAINSKFGWIIAGQLNINQPIKPTIESAYSSNCEPNTDISQIAATIEKFWKIEEILPVPTLSKEEQMVVDIFNKTSTINQNKITVCLPFKHSPPKLGESCSQATRRFYALEHRLQKDDALKKAYYQFMAEYLALDHMELIPQNQIDRANNKVFYLPHHPVIKESSSTTKVRVVFDASARSTNNHSLNDNLIVGPTIQDNLLNLLIRFRKHKYIFSADIEKMFRQILMTDNDKDYHRIIWRDDPNSSLKHYRLKTVTYGTASAPFLAIGALHYLADKFNEQFPKASDVLKTDFYMDDLMSGAGDLESAKLLQSDIINLLKLGGFNIRKWSSNHPQLLANIPIENREMACWEITDNQMVSVLGIKYNPIEDYFFFRITLSPINQFTKRSFLSEIARIYDPLGLLSPVTIGLKILFQSLWLHGIIWDEELPLHILEQYLSIRNQLHQLAELKFPRWLYMTEEPIELHGFGDASLDAYAAVIYSRSIINGQPKVNLLAAKTRVTPIKALSIPKLELNAATLLVRLLNTVLQSLKLPTQPDIYLYSDSTITLQWLSKPPKLLKPFEANRVSEILQSTKLCQWYFVATENNPADHATRGVKPDEFLRNPTWINGPEFLNVNQLQLIKPPPTVNNANETIINFAIVPPNFTIVSTLIAKYSKFRTMSHILAYILRYKANLLTRKSNRITSKYLTTFEILNAEHMIFRFVQHEAYGKYVNLLLNNKPLPNDSKILSFHPYVDNHGVLRVGGRLKHAIMNHDTKHPIILPSNHLITEMIVRETHYKNFHAGPKMMNTILRQRYAIPRCKNLIRRIVHMCFVCRRYKAQQQQQLMGQLPSCRVNPPVRPFIEIGIDLAGPFILKTTRARGAKLFKAYIVIFVCMATKACSIEVATDMSADTFLAALKRFCAVRGLPNHIYCDNGTNFVGAKRQLQEFYKQYLNDVQENKIQAWCSDHQIIWHFIPPATPTFGGLWEATVKSCKHHLRRVIGETHLTYEEFLTIIKEIEALLNSRPLEENQDDEWNPLTPSHFLIFQPLTILPEPDLQMVKMSHLNRWQLIQQLLQGFWKQWSQEYVTTLNKCYKWHRENRHFKTGDLVLLRDQNLPPARWPLARICDTHPGDDNIVRVVSLRLANGSTLKRPIYKLCVLPNFDSGESTAAECLK